MDEALRMNLSDGLSWTAWISRFSKGRTACLPEPISAITTHPPRPKTLRGIHFRAFGQYGRVDGRFASMTSDIRVVMGSPVSYAHAGGTYRNTSVDRNAVDRLMEITSGIKVSAHVPAV